MTQNLLFKLKAKIKPCNKCKCGSCINVSSHTVIGESQTLGVCLHFLASSYCGRCQPGGPARILMQKGLRSLMICHLLHARLSEWPFDQPTCQSSVASPGNMATILSVVWNEGYSPLLTPREMRCSSHLHTEDSHSLLTPEFQGTEGDRREGTDSNLRPQNSRLLNCHCHQPPSKKSKIPLSKFAVENRVQCGYCWLNCGINCFYLGAWVAFLFC